MPVNVEYDSAEGLLVITATGEATADLFREAMALITTSSSHPADADALWDLRGLLLDRTDASFVRSLVAIRGEFEARARARVALVVGSDLQFGMGRQYELTGGERTAGVAVFRSVEAARAWLRPPPG